MDWFRRNWPDLLIGIALVAVIAGIIATLITGGSFFPVGQTTRTTAPPAQSSGTAPSATAPGSTTPSTSTGTSGSATAGSASSGPAATTPDGSGAGAAGTTSPSTGSAATTSNGSSATGTEGGSAATSSGSGIAVLPPSDDGSAATPSGSSATPSTPAASGSSSASGSSTATSAGSGTSTSTAPSSTPSASTASPSSASGPGTDAPYRISVGAFGQAANAERQAAVFRDAGYPVFTADQGDLTIVLVGPYASQSEAESVAARIRAGDFGVDPVIYRFQGGADTAPAPAASSGAASSGAASSGAASGSASTAGSAGTASTAGATSAPIPTSDSGRYLQVGAYANADSAQPQKQRLASLGFDVTERNEGGLVKLLIGPFDAARLQQAQSELNAAGIESFPR